MLEIQTPAPGYKAVCPRCGLKLVEGYEGVTEAVAYHVTALMLFVVANAFPFITYEMEGRSHNTHLINGIFEFFNQGFWNIGILVALVTFVFPLFKIAGTLYVLYPLRYGRHFPYARKVFAWIETLHPWSMVEVFSIGIIVAYVKLIDYATVELHTALYAFGALIVVLVAGDAAINRREVWNALGPSQGSQGDGDKVLVCHICDFVLTDAAEEPVPHCPRCESHMHHRKPNGLARCAALSLAAALFYIPANIYPVMTVIWFGRGFPDTIISGVLSLIKQGLWPLAVIIFFASILIPILKILVLAFLMLSVKLRSSWKPRLRTQMFRLTEAIGRWSMIDVFMVGILIALVRLGNLASVEAGAGVASFAAVVVLTMFAAHAFDPRLIWDRMEKQPHDP
ncbi:MAG: paraquat-inducible protein A, partial [Myxococcota bacterium]